MTGMRAGLSRARHPAALPDHVVGEHGRRVRSGARGRGPAAPSVRRRSKAAELVRALVTMAVLVVITELRPIMMSRFEGDPISISPGLRVRDPVPVGAGAGGGPDGGVHAHQRAPRAQGRLEAVLQRGRTTPCPCSLPGRSSSRGVMAGDGRRTSSAPGDLGLVALSWVAYHLVNLAQVAGLAEDQTWWESFTEDFWFYTVSTVAVLALSPLVAVVAIHDDYSWVLLPLLLPAAAGGPAHGADVPGARAPGPGARAPGPARSAHRPAEPDPAGRSDRGRAGPQPRAAGERLVVLFLDLDSFKTVNDGLGHGIGDALLVDVAERLTAVTRPGDTLSRFSGDEFAIVCEAIRDREVERLVDDHPADHRRTVHDRHARGHPHREHRGGARHARRERPVADPGGRLGHVPRQERRARPGSALPPGHARSGHRPPRRPAGPASGPGARRAARALPAGRRPDHRRGRRHGGPDPVAAPGARAASVPTSSSRWPRRPG